MRLKTLSATSAEVYESCPARWKAEKQDYAPNIQGTAANLGIVCHEALEVFVKDEVHLNGNNVYTLITLFEQAYDREFQERDERFEDGKALLRKWHKRTDWTGREVLSTEVKQFFEIPTANGPIKFNYVFDRFDKLDNGQFEVVDYKTSGFPIRHDDLKHKLQARCYALAAQIAHPEADRIWVTFDMLRFDPIGVAYTKDENRDTYRYLVGLAGRILADNNPQERLNPECRFCVRRHDCRELRKHVNAGGQLSITDPVAAVDERAKINYAIAALKKNQEELDAFLLKYAEENDLLELEGEHNLMKVTAARRRFVDPAVVTRIVGPTLAAKHGAMSIKGVEAMLAGPDLNDDQKAELKASIGMRYQDPSIKTEPRKAI